MAAPGLIISNEYGPILPAAGTIVAVPLAEPAQLVVNVVVKEGAVAAATVTEAVAKVPQTSVIFTVYDPGESPVNVFEFWAARTTGEGYISSYVYGDPPPAPVPF